VSSTDLFARISIIAVGDLYQLPPIRKRSVFDDFKIEALNLCHPWRVFRMVELSEIMRPKNDRAFTELLNRIRTASHTEDDINVLQSRCITPSDADYPSDALHIWAENAPVDEHNQRKLEEIQAPLFILKANDQYPINVSKQDIDRVLSRGRSETSGLDFEIFVKEGVRVMLTTNINIPDRLINGQMGTVVKIDVNPNNETSTVLYIKFDDEKAGKTMINTGANIFARENQVVPIKPGLAKIKVRPGKASSPEIQRIQFPIALFWACTVHKVQGLTLQNVVVSRNLNKQRSFNYGQIYVALSRAISLQGLHIWGQIESRHIKANPKVHEECERLRSSASVSTPFMQHDCSCRSVLTLSLLNVRSLRKHSKDIRFHLQLFKSDILALTETQLLPNDSDKEITENLKPFKIYRQDHITDKYSGMAVCTRDTVQMVD
jgi:ATP-dependent exoDNAse (exonuclease V) alpha subunit